jgi:hypothetical protein
MPGSVTSVFSEAHGFEAALLEEGNFGLLVTGPGAFRARLTQVALQRIRLWAAEEYLPRIAFVAVPHDMILVSLANRTGSSPIWGGIETRAGDMITLGPGQRMHTRTEGPCRWTAIRMPDRDFARYGQALSGIAFGVPPVARWRPPPVALRELRQLHQTAVRMAEARSRALADVEAVHGCQRRREIASAGRSKNTSPLRCGTDRQSMAANLSFPVRSVNLLSRPDLASPRARRAA